MSAHDPTAEAIIDLLRTAGADGLRHAGGRSLLHHLVETAAIIERWRQPAALRHAALLHSVYGTDAFPERLLGEAQRAEVAEIAGAEAERLAHLFCVTPRGPLLAGTHRWMRGLAAPEPSTPAERDALVVMHMANLAEQARGRDGSPGRWLARVGALAELVADSEAVSLPVALAELARLDDGEELQAVRAYRAALECGDDPEARADRMALVNAVCPVVAEPCVWLAHLAWMRDDLGAARAWGQHARRRLARLGVAWDKRLSFEEWERLAAILEGPPAREPAAAAAVLTHPRALLQALTDGSPERPQPARSVAGVPDPATGRSRFHRYVETFADGRSDGGFGAYPELASRPWHDPHAFGLARYLEANFAAIREEVLRLSDVFHRESERIARTGDWDVAFLYERGRRRDEICDACPVTARGIEAHGAMLTLDGLSYVSRMRAGTHIRAHRGPTNLRLRCHLGIVVPGDDCAIRVADETRHWHEGSCLVFDDHFEHEAWNHSGEDRIVLIVDLWHPGLSATEIRLLEGLHGTIHRRAQGLHRYWSANAAARRPPAVD